MFKLFIAVGLVISMLGCASATDSQQSFREGHELRQQMEFIRTTERFNQVQPNIRLDKLPR